MPQRLQQMSDLQSIAASAGIASVAGMLNYMLKCSEGKAFSWGEFILHGAISAFFGFLVFEFTSYQGYPAELCGAFSGVAGWAGTRLSRLAWIVIQKKLGITREDLTQGEPK